MPAQSVLSLSSFSLPPYVPGVSIILLSPHVVSSSSFSSLFACLVIVSYENYETFPDCLKNVCEFEIEKVANKTQRSFANNSIYTRVHARYLFFYSSFRLSFSLDFSDTQQSIRYFVSLRLGLGINLTARA